MRRGRRAQLSRAIPWLYPLTHQRTSTVSGAIGLAVVPPVLLGTAYGIWRENQLDKEVWQVIDERVSAPAEAGSETPTDQPGFT